MIPPKFLLPQGIKKTPKQSSGHLKQIIPSSFIQTLTVGPGITPDQPFGSRALPPVRTCTSPWRYIYHY